MVTPLAIQNVKVPASVEVTVKGAEVTAKGKNATLTRTFQVPPGVKIEKTDSAVVVSAEYARKKTGAMVGTVGSHIRNMVRGAQQDYEYQMKVVYSHFPIKTKIQGDRFLVENFLGEKVARKARISPGVKVEAKGDQVVLTGPDLEAVSQTAARIELSTRVRGYDRRVFQDGIYITHKGK